MLLQFHQENMTRPYKSAASGNQDVLMNGASGLPAQRGDVEMLYPISSVCDVVIFNMIFSSTFPLALAAHTFELQVQRRYYNSVYNTC